LACAEALGVDINRPVATVSVDVCEEGRMNFGEGAVVDIDVCCE
jgi:hypothetical protein